MKLIKINFRNYCHSISNRNCTKLNTSKNVISNSQNMRTTKDMQIKSRENPIIFKLDSPEFHNIFSKEVKDLKKLFDKYQYEIRIAGGAVRDLLLGEPVKNLDFATTATPQQMLDMLKFENINWTNMFKAKYGTVTPEMAKQKTYEITTLRIDKYAEGNETEVEFIKDWKLDTHRRDFTVNTMFLDFDGTVYDYLFGHEDLQNRRLAFVGEPDIRIKEDPIRIMRYFRFYGIVAKEADNHEHKILERIKNNAVGLQKLSHQILWTELKKILHGKYGGNLLRTMIDVNVGKYIGIPNQNTEELCKLIERSGHLNLHPMTYLAALMRHVGDVAILHERLMLSNYEVDMLNYIVENRQVDIGPGPLLHHYKKLVVIENKSKQKVIFEYLREILKYRGDEAVLQDFNKWEIPIFPINRKILNKNSVPPDTFKYLLPELKDIWIKNEFKQSAHDLIKLVPHILDENKNV